MGRPAGAGGRSLCWARRRDSCRPAADRRRFVPVSCDYRGFRSPAGGVRPSGCCRTVPVVRAGYRFCLYRKADRLPSGGRKIGDGAELPADAEQLRRIFERSGHSVLTAGRTTGKPVRRLAAAETDCTQYRLFLYAGAACRFQQGGPGGHRVAKFSFPECIYRRGPYPQARRRRRDRHTAPAVESGTLPLLGAGAGYFYFQLLRAGYGVRRYRLPAQAGHRRRGDMLCPPQNGTAPYDPYRTLHGRYHRTLCAGYPHVGLCFSFAECGGPGPGILPVPDCSGILQPPAQTAGGGQRPDARTVRLKRLAELLGLEMPLSSYTSRHTWATTARNHNVPLSIISAGMGHASEKTTQIYLASLESSVVDQANRSIIASLYV